jgi:hypothetical protein
MFASHPESSQFSSPAAALLATIFLVGWLHTYVTRRRLGLKLLPGLWRLPIIGNLHQLVLAKKAEAEQFHEWCKALGTGTLSFRGSRN